MSGGDTISILSDPCVGFERKPFRPPRDFTDREVGKDLLEPAPLEVGLRVSTRSPAPEDGGLVLYLGDSGC